MGIGNNIKIITGFKGMTLVELSKKSGVPINTIYTLTHRGSRQCNAAYYR